jgi:hypothetical protein
MASVVPSSIESLRTELRGELIMPTDATYESARRVWNAMIRVARRTRDKRQALGGRRRAGH